MSKGQKIGLSLFVVLALLLVLIPVVAKQIALSQIKKMGVETVAIDNVDFNPFLLTAAVEGLRIGDESSHHLFVDKIEADVSWLRLFSGVPVVESLLVSGVDLQVEQRDSGIYLGIPIEPSTEVEEEPKEEETDKGLPDFGVDWVQLSDAKIRFIQDPLDVEVALDDVDLEHLYSNDQQDTLLKLNGAINGGKVALTVKSQPLNKPLKADVQLDIEGFPINSLAAVTPKELSLKSGTLDTDYQIKVVMNENGSIELNHQGVTKVDQLALEYDLKGEHYKVADFGLQVDGELTASLDPESKPGPVTYKGKITQTVLDATLPSPKLNIKHQGVWFDGGVSLEPENVEESLQVAGQFGVDDLTSTIPKQANENGEENGEEDKEQNEITLSKLGHLEISGIAVKGINDISASELVLADLTSLQHENLESVMLYLGKLQVKDFSLRNQNQLTIADVEFNHLKNAIQRDAKGQLVHVEPVANHFSSKNEKATAKDAVQETAPTAQNEPVLKGEESKESEPNTETAEANQRQKGDFNFDIGLVKFTGDSEINIRDEAVKPALVQHILLNNVEVSDIHSQGDLQGMKLNLLATINDYSKVTVTGSANPFADKMDADIKVLVEQVDLTPLSPYVSQQTGYNIQSGALSLDTKVVIVKDQLDIEKNTIKLNKIVLKPDDQEKLDQLTKELTMPLDYALNILRDKKGNVKLNVPIKGDVNNPDFSVNHVMRIAMGKALKMASVSYLKNFLQPYGTLITVAQTAGNYATRVTIDPVKFDQGQAGISDDAKAYLGKVSDLLSDKDGLQVAVCGVATFQDWRYLQEQLAADQASQQSSQESSKDKDQKASKSPAESPVAVPIITSIDALSKEEKQAFIESHKKDEALINLARERGKLVKDYLVERKIGAKRLVPCNPSVDFSNDTAQPRVELSI